jgi:hypothetical protein
VLIGSKHEVNIAWHCFLQSSHQPCSQCDHRPMRKRHEETIICSWVAKSAVTISYFVYEGETMRGGERGAGTYGSYQQHEERDSYRLSVWPRASQGAPHTSSLADSFSHSWWQMGAEWIYPGANFSLIVGIAVLIEHWPPLTIDDKSTNLCLVWFWNSRFQVPPFAYAESAFSITQRQWKRLCYSQACTGA